jgi:hypothetical protein
VPDVVVQLLVGVFSSRLGGELPGRTTLFLALDYVPEDDVFFAHECAHLVHRAAGFDGDNGRSRGRRGGVRRRRTTLASFAGCD